MRWVQLTTENAAEVQPDDVAAVATAVLAEDDGATTPDPLGSLIQAPDLSNGTQRGLFEDTTIADYQTHWQDPGGWGTGPGEIMESLADMVVALLTNLGLALSYGAVALSWWTDRVTRVDVGGADLAEAMSAVSRSLTPWLLPAALGIGVLVAMLNQRRGEDWFGQVAWMLVIGMVCVGLGSEGTRLYNGLDDSRTLISDAISSASADHVQETQAPFDYPAPGKTGDPAVDVARSSGDAMWRMFAVTPWCEAQFGSLDACKRYGADWVKLGGWEEREKYVETVIAPQEGGMDSPTVRYITGRDPGARIAASAMVVLSGVFAVILVGSLSILALIPWLTVLVLMFVAVPVACISVIPGRPRQMGGAFLGAILGLTLVSALSMGILYGGLLLLTAVGSVSASLGFVPAIMLAIAALIAAFRARSVAENIITGQNSGGSALGGALRLMAVSRLIGRVGSRSSNRGKSDGGEGQRADQGAQPHHREQAGRPGGTPRAGRRPGGSSPWSTAEPADSSPRTRRGTSQPKRPLTGQAPDAEQGEETTRQPRFTAPKPKKRRTAQAQPEGEAADAPPSEPTTETTGTAPGPRSETPVRRRTTRGGQRTTRRPGARGPQDQMPTTYRDIPAKPARRAGTRDAEQAPTPASETNVPMQPQREPSAKGRARARRREKMRRERARAQQQNERRSEEATQ